MKHRFSASDCRSAREKTVGYGFHPTDAELVGYFLNRKNLSNGNDDDMPISEIKVCDFEPWDLPGHSKIKSKDQTWYFFSRRDLKYSNRPRVNRTTKAGSWKVTGKQREVKAIGSTKKVIGHKTTLIFCKKGYPKNVKTEWIMHQYDQDPQGNFLVYKLKTKSGGKINKAKPNEIPLASDLALASASTSKSAITVNSSCGECDPSHHMDPVFEYLNLEKMTALSDYDKDEQGRSMAYDFGNLSENEVTSRSTCNESDLCQHPASSIEDQSLFCKMRSYFKSQNSCKITGISIFERGEWNPMVETPECGSQMVYMSKSSVVTGLEINATEASMLEEQGPPTFFDDLKTLSEPNSSHL